MEAFFEFEKPIVNLEKKLQDLRELANQEGVDFAKEISVLEKKVAKLIDETYAKLSPWQKVQLSRHPGRPYTRDYVDALFPDFMELHGDRAFGDDQAVLVGTATWPPAIAAAPAPAAIPANGANGSSNGAGNSSASAKAATPTAAKAAGHEDTTGQADRFPVLIIGHQKGRNTKQKMERNFGMARPEGYRKAMRLMQLAERARMPVITFIDTPGAYPGMDAEERGQSAAIAESIELMFKLTVPVIAVVIGEGGSGGALAIGVANSVLMQEYSTYSVISPESCASILWSDSSLAERASEKLKMSPTELLRMGVIDGIIPEPKGGAHRDWVVASNHVREALIKQMDSLMKTGRKNPETLSAERIQKFRGMGKAALGHAPVSANG